MRPDPRSRPETRRRLARSHVLHLDEVGFQEHVLGCDGVALVAFGIDGLRSWAELTNLLDEVCSSDLVRDSRSTVAVVDVDECPGLSNRYAITTVPTTLVLLNAAEVGRLQGLRQPHHYAIALETAVAALGPASRKLHDSH